MESSLLYGILADAVLLLHFLFAAFIVAGLVLIYVGHGLGWRWIRNPWFRWAHLAGIGIVAFQSWIGVICPVTNLEMWLRQRAGDEVYAGSFIAHWVESLLYYDLPAWVFILAYTLFGMLVLASWFLIAPERLNR